MEWFVIIMYAAFLVWFKGCTCNHLISRSNKVNDIRFVAAHVSYRLGLVFGYCVRVSSWLRRANDLLIQASLGTLDSYAVQNMLKRNDLLTRQVTDFLSAFA